MYPRVAQVATVGGAGVAAGDADVWGFGASRLDAVSVDYDAAAPVTTTVVISFPETPGQADLVLAAGNTDRVVRPRVPVQDMAGVNIAGRGEEPPVVLGRANVAVDNCDALAVAATVRLFFR